MSREDFQRYVMETLLFDELTDMGAVDHFTSWDMAYNLTTNCGAHGIYLEYGFNNENQDNIATAMLPPEIANERGVLDFFRHHGYPPAVRLHRLAVLSLLSEKENDQD